MYANQLAFLCWLFWVFKEDERAAWLARRGRKKSERKRKKEMNLRDIGPEAQHGGLVQRSHVIFAIFSIQHLLFLQG